MPDPDHETAAARGHVPEQYEAGYGARFRQGAFGLGATRSWQAGWTDANRELGNFEEAFSPAQSSLPFFGTGEEARRRDLPFNPSCSKEWKRRWIEADIRVACSSPEIVVLENLHKVGLIAHLCGTWLLAMEAAKTK